jgi:hypothetical protein
MIIWGFVAIVATMVPAQVGPYGSMQECYAGLSQYIMDREKVDTKSQYRGRCDEFPKIGKFTQPTIGADWFTSAQLATMATQ